MISLRGLHPEVRNAADYAIRWAEYYDIPVTVTSGYRTWEEQAKLRARWEAGNAPYPANRPGDSAHNWGLAFDSWVPDPYWPAWHYIRQAVGFQLFPETDRVHAQYPSWRSVVTGWPRPTELGWI